MDETRRKYIDGIVDSLRDKYQTTECIDWEVVSYDHKILHLDSPRFFIPLSFRMGGFGVIVTTPLDRVTNGIDNMVHEFGHYFLGHTDEDTSFLSRDEGESEANYFAQQLQGEVENHTAPEWRHIVAEITHPWASYKSMKV